MKTRKWETWQNIFAWRNEEEMGLYVNVPMFGLEPLVVLENVLTPKNETFFCALQDRWGTDNTTQFDDELSIVFVDNRMYMDIFDIIPWHDWYSHNYYDSDTANQAATRLWHAACRKEFIRIAKNPMGEFSWGLAPGTPPTVVFSDEFYRQYYRFLEGRMHYTRRDFLITLRPDLFAVENKIEVDTGGQTGEKDVYFIQGCETQRIKIGISNNVDSRLKGIQSSEPLKLLAVIKQGGKDLERRLHQKFQGLRVHGEWFRPDPQLLEYIGELTP